MNTQQKAAILMALANHDIQEAIKIVEAMPTQTAALKVHKGEICYKSDEDDQSFGMWCPVTYNTPHQYANETIFYMETD